MEQKKSFWQNPWLWGGCGCGLGCIGIPLLVVALLGGSVLYMFSNTDVKKLAAEQVRSSPAAVEALGEPMETGWLITGSINVSNDHGRADIRFPMSGPKGEASVHAVAEREGGGPWVFEELSLELEGGGAPLDLMEDEPPPTDPAPPGDPV
ncbi:MAG TPA: cytochrome c oxidase assembly factor 1 family protein [Thermoanaerobaculia bacterium]|nr:cytochrome c oxidase assembly factor 1 family protein [Thermoanaerobaculia bacterium]